MTYDSSLADFYEKAAYIKLFDALAGHNLLLEANPPFFTILAATTQRLQDVGMTKEAVIGKALFEAHPGNPTDPSDNGVSNLRSSLENVLRYKEIHQLPVQRYDLPNDQGGFTEKYWRASNRPVLNKEGEVAYIIHTAEDITHEIKARELEEKIKGLEQAYGLFMQAPFAIHIFTGPDLVIELANPPTLQLWGKMEDPTGKRFLDVLPELKGHGYDEMMQEVMQTGISKFFYEVPLQLNRPGKEPVGYFNFVYQPYYKEGAPKAESILIIANEVTEQVQAKKSIEESEARFRNLIDEAPVATCLFVGTDLVIEVVNRSMLDIFGKGDHVRGMKLTDALPELASQPFPHLLRQVLLTGEPYTGLAAEAELFKDGKWDTYYFDSTYKPIRNAAGQVYAVLGMAIDVTDRVMAQRALEGSERRFRALVNASSDVLYSMNADWTIMNPLDGRGFLLNAHAPVKNWMERNVHPSEFDTVKKTIAAAIANKTVFQLEHRVVTVDGSVGWTFSRAVPLLDDEGNIIEWFGTATDITTRKLVEQALKESESRFRSLADQSPIFVFIIEPDPQAPVNYWNKAWLDYTGQSMEEARGRGWEGIIHPEDLSVVMEAYAPAFEKKEPYFIPPVRTKRFDGIYRWHTFKGNPRFAADGSFHGYVGVGFDVHEQKMAKERLEFLVKERTKELAEANQTLQIINKELQRSNQNLEEFAHAASHDLKEPVRKIHFFTNQLKDQLSSQLHESQARAFHRIENATERMGNLIDDLLLYSHVSQRPHQTESVDLNQQVQRVLEDLDLDVEEKKAIITIGKLPVVQGYRRQLQQLFQNLISNAMKYSKRDTAPQIRIHASEVSEDGRLHHLIAITDNGIGFEQEYGEKIFQMFTRLHGKAEYSGTGVGLSIVKKVVENHNGFIKAESVSGEGSVFKIYLPLQNY
ncbi:PAS domain-containing protein [Flavisolibacter sp. BT320]|nr:PAS domain-containing protein [Flavisolibacter longurius]